MNTRIADRGGRLGAALHAGRELLKNPRTIGAVTLAVLALGGFLRLNRYLFNRSLFLDEAYIASSVLSRDFAGLAEPLDYFQVAPVGWISAVKLATELFGMSERALRLVPLLSGLASLGLLYPLARQFLSPLGSLAACLFLAVSDPAIQWSVMVKPYSTDLLISLVFLLLATRVSWRDLTARSTVALACLGALALWFSFPAAFVLAAVGGYGLVSSGAPSHRSRLVPLAVIGLVWAVSFALLRSATLSHVFENGFQFDAWGQYLVGLPRLDAQGITAQVDLLGEVFEDPLGLSPPGAGEVVFLLGLAAGLAAMPSQAALLLAPVTLAYLASVAGVYPFHGRLLLFSVPGFFIFIAGGLEQVFRKLKGLGWLAGAVLLFVLAFTPLRLGISRGLNPRPLEEVRPVTQHVLSNYRSGDAIYVYYGAEPTWKYYLNLAGAAGIQYDAGGRERENPEKYAEEIARYRGQARLWLVISHVYSGGLGNEGTLILGAARCLGTEIERYLQPGAQAYLYDMTRPSQDCQGT